MQTTTIFFTGPAQFSIISRRVPSNAPLWIHLAPFNGSVNSVTVQFGENGPTRSFTQSGGRATSGFTWGFVGDIDRFCPAGQYFVFTVSISGTIQIGWDAQDQAPITDFIEATGSIIYFLENVRPELSVDAYASPIGIKNTDLPYLTTLAGGFSEQNPSIYSVASVQYRVGNGGFANASIVNTTQGQGRWTTGPIALQPGDDQITILATDNWGTTTSVQKTIVVDQYVMPPVHPEDRKTADLGIPTTSSITSWTRLEPQVANADMAASANARLFDPLWMMTRQWQMGEFQAEDTGSPVQVRVRATTSLLTRSRFGNPASSSASTPYSPLAAPLETLVERRAMRASAYTDLRGLPLRVDAGLYFLRMLEQQALTKSYRNAFVAQYQLVPLSYAGGKTYENADEATRRFVQAMGGRAIDALRLAAVIRPNPDATLLSILGTLGVASADQPKVLSTMRAWVGWYDALFAEPGSSAQDAWVPDRLEYAASVAARLSAVADDSLTLSASEFDGGRLDWSSFDVDATRAIDTTADAAFSPLHERTVPMQITFPGAPAVRFWEMEDAKVAYGLVPVGPTDLAHLMMIEYASSYGNDWYMVPLDVRVGTVTRVDSLIVTDTFGVRMLVRPIGDPALAKPYFSMWQQSTLPNVNDPSGAPVRNRFFLPPTLGWSVDGNVLEDVLFTRDEMANVAWGIERAIEGGLEAPVSLASAANGGAAADSPAAGDPPRYVLSSAVPPNWVPLLPVQSFDVDGVTVLTRLRRGAVLQPDGGKVVNSARSDALTSLGTAPLFEEEVPREGTRITRRRRMTRWTDGSAWVWTAFRNDVGTGESSAGLVFDQLETSTEHGALAAGVTLAMRVDLGVDAAVINGASTPFTATIDNAGSKLSSVSLQAWITQGSARRAAGGVLVDAGSGAAMLPSGTSSVSGSIVVDNSGTGFGTLTFGAATLEVQLKVGSAVVAAASMSLDLVHQPAIAALSVDPAAAVIDGLGAPLSVALENLGPGLTSVSLRATVVQGGAGGTTRRSAGNIAVDCGAGAGVLPNGSFTLTGTFTPTNSSSGSGTLAPGAASLELQLVDGSGAVLDTRTAPVTLEPNTPSLLGVSVSVPSLIIAGAATSFTASLKNPGANRSNVALQAWMNQGTARRSAGGGLVDCGAGAGIMPNGTPQASGTIVASNDGGGTGTLVPGAATFELQLLVNSTLVETKFVPVTLEPNTPTITALTPVATSLAIGGPSIMYNATLKNPGPSLSSVVQQGYISQGSVRHAAGGQVVICGAGNGVLPTGTFNVTGSYSAMQTTGPGTLVTGPATFELELRADTLLFTRTVPVTLVAPQSITAVTPSSSPILVDGPGRPFTVTVQNFAASLSGISIQAFVHQGASVRASGSIFNFGAGSGILPSGAATGTGVTSALNTQTGSGTLAPGAATFEVQLKQGTTLLATSTIPVTLVAKPTVGAITPSANTLVIDGASASYSVALVNPGPTLSNVSALCWLRQGGTTVEHIVSTINDFGSGTRVLPNGTTNFTGSIAASNALPGHGTLTPGDATIEFSIWLMSSDGSGLLIDKRLTAVTLTVNAPSIAALRTDDMVIDGLPVGYAATITNPGASLASVTLQGVVIQGLTIRDAGTTAVSCGAGSGVLPNGTFQVSGPAVASNSSSGKGTLVSGEATFQLQVLVGTTVVATQSVQVSINESIPSLPVF